MPKLFESMSLTVPVVPPGMVVSALREEALTLLAGSVDCSIGESPGIPVAKEDSKLSAGVLPELR